MRGQVNGGTGQSPDAVTSGLLRARAASSRSKAAPQFSAAVDLFHILTPFHVK
jgi:hypothetical protein